MKLTNADNVTIKPETVVFDGQNSRSRAEKQAKKQRSYVFPVFKDTKNKKTNKKELVFFGFGVPK